MPKSMSLKVLYCFFKNVGILIDCSFTVPLGTFGVCNVGAVPPAVFGCTGFAGVGEARPKSSSGTFGVGITGASYFSKL